jgi:polyhydroxyalkanoate synthesis repressor PhaR
MQEQPGIKRLDIKKYPNRRYYDATHSRHLTLEEIRSLVQQGYDLRVTDARTSNDITAQVLTQIILELDTAKIDSLPVPLLMRLIRMNDQLIKDFIEKYFNQALRSFTDYQQQLEEQVRRAHGLPPLFSPIAAWTKAMLDPFAAAFRAPPMPEPPPAAGAPSPESARQEPDPSAAPPAGQAPPAAPRQRRRARARPSAAPGPRKGGRRRASEK